MNTYKITGYNKTTGLLTFDSAFNGVTYTGLKTTSGPKQTVEEVTAFIKTYMTAYVAGLAIETIKVSDIPAEVKALLNQTINLD
jgi:hypothetical protein